MDSDGRAPIRPHELRAVFVAIVRRFGLLEPGRTPCGIAVPVTHAHALTELLRGHDLKQSELGDRLGLTKSGASRMVSQLEAKGWATSRPDPGDGRVRHWQLTEAGERLATKIEAASLERFTTILNGVPAEARSSLVTALETLRSAL